MRTRLLKNERGAALIETAVTIPIVLLISVGIFEFGRAYQTWQVLTNASREGARQAILLGKTDADVQGTVQTYMRSGGLPSTRVASASVQIERNVAMGSNTASRITVSYPFEFMVIDRVAQLVRGGRGPNKSLTMQSVALMRNES